MTVDCKIPVPRNLGLQNLDLLSLQAALTAELPGLVGMSATCEPFDPDNPADVTLKRAHERGMGRTHGRCRGRTANIALHFESELPASNDVIEAKVLSALKTHNPKT